MESNNNADQYSDRKSRRTRKARRSHNNRMKIWGLTVVLLLLIIILIISRAYSSSQVDKLSNRVSSIQQQLFVKEEEVDDLRSQLTQLKGELKGYVEGRIPSVMSLVPDEVLEVNKDIIKNIVFSVIMQNGSKVYEYKLVMENLTKEIIVPKFKLLIFDKYGIQIGLDQVLKGEVLAPGESRSYSSKVEFFMNNEPVYFQVFSEAPRRPALRIQDHVE